MDAHSFLFFRWHKETNWNKLKRTSLVAEKYASRPGMADLLNRTDLLDERSAPLSTADVSGDVGDAQHYCI